MKKWLDANRLALNIDKTNFVILHPPCITEIPEPVIIRFGRKKIKHQSCVKCPGILLDENLSWKFHINELFKTLSRTVEIFYKIRQFIANTLSFFDLFLSVMHV